MKLLIDTEHSILVASIAPDGIGYPPSAPLPADFMHTFALGKYKGRLIGETVEVYAVPGWVPPPPQPSPWP